MHYVLIAAFAFAVFVLIMRPPAFLIERAVWRWEYILWRVPVEGKQVALTLNAPNGITPTLMRALGAIQAHNTSVANGTAKTARKVHITLFATVDTSTTKLGVLPQLVKSGSEVGAFVRVPPASKRSGKTQASVLRTWRNAMRGEFTRVKMSMPNVRWARTARFVPSKRFAYAVQQEHMGVCGASVYTYDALLARVAGLFGSAGVYGLAALVSVFTYTRLTPGYIVMLNDGPHLPLVVSMLVGATHVNFCTVTELWDARARDS